MSGRLGEVSVYRPYPDEIPWELLALADPDEARVRTYAKPDLMRVAKHHGEAVGVYVIRPQSVICWELLNLAVAPGWRRQGLGRWLLGHAIGVAESKGGREIRVNGAPRTGLLIRTGFVPEGNCLRLLLTPE